MVQSGRFQGVERSGTEVENSCEDGQANEHETLRVGYQTFQLIFQATLEQA